MTGTETNTTKTDKPLHKPDKSREAVPDQENSDAGSGPHLNTGSGESDTLVNPGVRNPVPGATTKG